MVNVLIVDDSRIARNLWSMNLKPCLSIKYLHS